MPELPDLQVFAKNLQNLILNKKIVSAKVFSAKKINVDTNEMESALNGTSIVSIEREGKELFFNLENNNVLSVHLMLNGRFDVCKIYEVSNLKHKILAIDFEDDSALVISDFQMLCKISLNPTVSNSVPDALSESFTVEYLIDAVKKNSRKNIKSFLLNQDIVKGIGNAYADEILWKANISPNSIIGKVPEENLRDLYNAILYVLKEAIVNIEKISPDIISGEERSFLKVHNPNKKKTDDGDEILIDKIASKTTYYIEKQQLFK